MASSSSSFSSSGSSRRSGSPFQFYKAASVDGTLPGLSHFNASFSSTPSNFSGGGGGGGGRTPTIARIPTPSTSTFKFNFGNPSVVITSAPPPDDMMEFQQQQAAEPKESVSVTVRFRPLSLREIQKGDEVAWYADGDAIVRSEYNPATAYAFDKVFGPATTTRCVYDVAAQNVVQGAMEGINGTVFAYGVTSSGKTYTMHGDPKSPGIIPLAVKDVFSIIQDTPDREYLLRVSYLEIYNEVINDLLDPAGQNLRIREDAQGTYVEGIKEEVVLSPAHALSLISAGEEHRHVGSNNYNLLSSRSHTVFTLTVESSPRASDQYDDDDEVTLSQLNLIDLAGSESSKTETTGQRRKEGSYINKSLLTLGTVIGKLSEGKASHVPYRDSKLTRLLQSSLGGYGRVSLICTLTPASSNVEETHNTLKFAYRAKRVTIQATPNRIIDEKSLIKKYQKEILSLKEELDQFKRGIFEKPYILGTPQEDLLSLRQQLEAGQVKLQSRLEEEEQAKAALLGRIQRLTKLILVSSKNSTKLQEPEQLGHRRRHSFGDEKLASLGERRQAFALGFNDDSGLIGHASEPSLEGKIDISGVEDIAKEEKKSKRWGMLGWFKLRKNETVDTEFSPNGCPASAAFTPAQLELLTSLKAGQGSSFSQKAEDPTLLVESLPELRQAGELFCAAQHGQRPPPSGVTMADQMDLLREQLKMRAGEVALCTSSLRQLSEQAVSNPDDEQLQAQMEETKAEIQEKKRQIRILEQHIIGTGQAALEKASPIEMSETILKLMSQLNEKEFDLEIKAADNRILQEQLQTKLLEVRKLQETIASMRHWHTNMPFGDSTNQKTFNAHPWTLSKRNTVLDVSQLNGGLSKSAGSIGDFNGRGTEADVSDSESYSSNGSSRNVVRNASMQSQMLIQAAEIENLKQEKVCLEEENEGLQIQSQKLAEEASYAKELASAAAVELRSLAEEVTKLSFQNSKLANDLVLAQEAAFSRKSGNLSALDGHFTNMMGKNYHRDGHIHMVNQAGRALREGDIDSAIDMYDDIDSWKLDPEDMKKELYARKEREMCLEAALADKEQAETEVRKKLEEAKKREADLENDLAGMWVQLAKLKREKGIMDTSIRSEVWNSLDSDISSTDSCVGIQGDVHDTMLARQKPQQGQLAIEELRASLEEEKQRTVELKTLVSQLKSEELEGLQLSTLEELQNLHVEALTKLFQAKARSQDKVHKEREDELSSDVDQQDDERNGHVCKICFEAPTAAVLLPCRHFCLCKRCAVACTECPLCRSGIADRIITFTS